MNINEYKNRRQELMDILSEGSMAILPAAPMQLRNCDVHYPYRQDSNFYYLTGFPEPQALAVIVPQREQGQYLLFCREKNQNKEALDGNIIGLEDACEIYGADDAFPITDIDDIIPGLMESCRCLYYPMGYYEEFDDKIIEWINQLREHVRSGKVAPFEMVSVDHILHEMRLQKTDAEIQALRAAADVSILAHKRAMQFCRPDLYEYELEAEITYELLRNGCRAEAFPTSVAGGKNACILHYTENKDILNNGDLVLIDAGAEINHYASDISRTFPVNGHFSKPQKTLYELVLKAQRAAIGKIYPGNQWNDPYNAAIVVITEGLKDLGLLVGKVDILIEEEAYKRFYTDHIGHWLGMDVHDPGNYKIDDVWRYLEPGMVMTVEPGLYIPAAEDISEEWWNIGIRIEDNVLITEGGHEVLTSELPKTVIEIETLMARKAF
ncbi:aminopeptidase P N-terminal domain-containing protein [Candidatus Parabeggiatoa sp. HSG14]|uniref:aminopeptidase P N-terminal domain-containing protein n=1 Tax=Candidatus Parabeggiatoa sp. HSG14 TaxID=3055593 RepID=UPI0025A7F6BC|nr:aminopeptidase P N-terminal domain-containing protein [Thiotrichales bacterium HSG14]